MKVFEGKSDRAKLFRGASVGLANSLISLGTLAGAQYWLALHLLVQSGITDQTIITARASNYRHVLLIFYAPVTSMVLAHWLLVAILGKGHILNIRVANRALVLAGLTLASIPYSLHLESLLRATCPLLGISVTTSNPYGFDSPSPCGTFAAGGSMALQVLPPLLLAASALLRILISRRQ